MLEDGYGFRQGTLEWARLSAEALLAAAPAAAADQRRAAHVYLGALEYGVPVRIEPYHAEYQIVRTRRYLLFSWRP